MLLVGGGTQWTSKGEWHAEADDRSCPRGMGRRIELERRIDRASGSGLHRPHSAQPPPRGGGRRRVRRVVSRAAHNRSCRPGRPFLWGRGGHEAGTAGGDVKALVYVDAFIPEVDENVFQILGGSGSALDVPDPTAVLDIVGYPGAPEGDAEAFLKPSTVHNAFAQDLPEADRWLIVASQRPITLGANTAPTETAAWKTIPSWAVVGTEDRVIPPATQRSMAERAGSTITEIAGSHVSLVSHPAAAIDAILAAAAATDD